MTRRVETDSHVFPRLESGDGGTECNRTMEKHQAVSAVDYIRET